MFLTRRLFCLLAILFSCLSLHAQTTYNTIVIFGDSLSDTGNIAHLTQSKYGVRYPADNQLLGLNYTDGRFTDGMDTQPAAQAYFGVWAEQFAASFPAKPAIKNSLDGGTNYAYGDATTGPGTTTFSEIFNGIPVSVTLNNMGQQVTDYLATNPTPNAQTLYVLWGGSNDLFNDPTTATATTAVQNELALVQRLMAVGATNFLIPNLPPLGGTGTDPASTALNTASGYFSGALTQGIATLKQAASLQSIPLTIYQPDIFDLTVAIGANPTSVGLSNVTVAAQGVSDSPDTYLFWDGVHPTTTGHHYAAAAAAALFTPLVTSSTKLTAPANSIALQPVTLSATVAPSTTSSSAPIPTGLVTFYSGTSLIGSSPLDSTGTGTVSLTPIVAASPYAITAVYAGDTTFKSALSAASSLTVLASAVATTTVVGSSGLSANLGSAVTFTAMVTPSVSTYGVATGTVTFMDGTTVLGTGTLANGAAAFSISTLTAGTHSIAAFYAASGVFGASSSSVIKQVITTPTTTKITVPATVTAGQTVTVSAVVTSTLSTPKPTGLVTFYNAGAAIGSGMLDSIGATSATFTAATASSPYNVTAIYAGDTNFTASTSPASTVTVTAAPISTTTSVMSSALTANLNSAVTFTAVVIPSVGTSGAPTGSVTFFDGTTSIGTGTVGSSAAAVFTTSTLTAGTHIITATYVPTGVFTGSTSGPISQVIVAPNFTAVASPNPLTVVHGASGSSTITVTPVGGYSGTLTFTCGTLPTAHISCAFAPATLTFTASSSATQTATLTLATNAASAFDIPARPGTFTAARIFSAILFGPGLGGLFLASIRRRRSGSRSPRLMLLLLLLSAGSLLGVTGCGGSGSTSTTTTTTTTTTAAAGTYTLPLTLTPSSGSASTVSLQVVIQ